MRRFKTFCLLSVLLLACVWSSQAAETLDSFDEQVKQWALECRDEVAGQFTQLLSSGELTMPQLFDTFYIPVAGTDPQKFHTQYDRTVDPVLVTILDKYLNKDIRLVFLVAVDRNGYLPTHNSRYSQPLTGNWDEDMKWNRTKRLFNDRTGLAAARNEQPFLLQRYSRDTGEIMSDISVPLFINERHWGAIRVGYTKQ